MKKIKIKRSEIYLYEGDDRSDNKKKIIFTHGMNCSYASEFMQYIINFLTKKRFSIGTFEFKFLLRKKPPSGDLLKEIEELAEVVNYMKSIGIEDICLLGKSLGGVINLAFQSLFKDEKIKSLIQLGLPVKLGYPPRLNLLKEKKPILPNYLVEYEKLLKSFNSEKFFIIQGNKDDLYDREIENILNKKNIFYIDKANHDFVSEKDLEKKYYKDCSEKIINILDSLHQ